MAKTYQYCVAENWGKGFIDHVESQRITFVSFPGNIWQVPAYNKHGNLWIAKVGGTLKTKDEAQVIVDAVITSAQNAWDSLPDDEKAPEVETNKRPTDIILEE
tara:strand:- start:246 stop:554 length:309 start_codon:yes stop_codon:yes gene_type:complete